MSTQRNLPTNNVHINDPAVLIANIPGILGFYPENSIIILALEHSTGATYNLGPVLRADSRDPAAVHSLLETMSTPFGPLDTDLLFAVIVDDDEQVIDHVSEQLFGHILIHRIPVQACWTLPVIQTGQPYRIAIGPDRDITAEHKSWASGVVAPVADAASMRSWHDAGLLPEVNRATAMNTFRRGNPHLPSQEADLIATTMLTEYSGFDPDRNHEDGHILRTEVEYLTQQVLAEEHGHHEQMVDNYLTCIDVLTQGATVMANSWSRDILVADVVEDAEYFAPFLEALARSFGGEIRANALCLYAIAVAKLGLGQLAHLALVASHLDQRRHRLTVFMLEWCMHGNLAGSIDSVASCAQTMLDQHAAGCEDQPEEDD